MAKSFGGEGNNKPQARTAPPYPETCQNAGCSNDTSVVMMSVFNKNNGKTEIGSFGAHMKKPAFGFVSGDQICMNEQFDFRHWITRCASCYQIDLKGAGLSSAHYALSIRQGQQ